MGGGGLTITKVFQKPYCNFFFLTAKSWLSLGENRIVSFGEEEYSMILGRIILEKNYLY